MYLWGGNAKHQHVQVKRRKWWVSGRTKRKSKSKSKSKSKRKSKRWGNRAALTQSEGTCASLAALQAVCLSWPAQPPAQRAPCLRVPFALCSGGHRHAAAPVNSVSVGSRESVWYTLTGLALTHELSFARTRARARALSLSPFFFFEISGPCVAVHMAG